jgi:hypothetical protein
MHNANNTRHGHCQLALPGLEATHLSETRIPGPTLQRLDRIQQLTLAGTWQPKRPAAARGRQLLRLLGSEARKLKSPSAHHGPHNDPPRTVRSHRSLPTTDPSNTRVGCTGSDGSMLLNAVIRVRLASPRTHVPLYCALWRARRHLLFPPARSLMRFAPGAVLLGGGCGQLGVLAGRRRDGSGLRQLAIEILPSLIAGTIRLAARPASSRRSSRQSFRCVLWCPLNPGAGSAALPGGCGAGELRCLAVASVATGVKVRSK